MALARQVNCHAANRKNQAGDGLGGKLGRKHRH